MDIAKQDFLYEVLLRFDVDGFVAAHQIHVEKYVDNATGEVISEKQGAPMPLLADEIKGLLGEEVVGMALKVSELETRVEQSQA